MIIERFCFSLPEWLGMSTRRNSTGNFKARSPRWSTVFRRPAIQRFKSQGVSVLLALLFANPVILPNASAQVEMEDSGDFEFFIIPAEIEDSGDFELFVMPADSSDDAIARVVDFLAGPGRSGLESVVEDLNTEFNLERSVSIVFSTWSEIDEMADASVADRAPGALFDRNGTEDIYISYEFMAEILKIFGGNESAWYPNVINIVLHEVGHALIEINDITAPRDGSEAETAADELAFFVLSEFYEAEDELRQVAEHFSRAADAALNAKSDHYPDQDRAERYRCWIAGRFEGSEAPFDCDLEYYELVDAWDERLAPSWKGAIGKY